MFIRHGILSTGLIHIRRRRLKSQISKPLKILNVTKWYLLMYIAEQVHSKIWDWDQLLIKSWKTDICIIIFILSYPFSGSSQVQTKQMWTIMNFNIFKNVFDWKAIAAKAKGIFLFFFQWYFNSSSFKWLRTK